MSPTTTISRCGGTTTTTYAQAIVTLQSSYTLVALWHLTEGASPYADTSGFAPADPATLTRQVGVTAMTQSYSPGPLVGSQAGSAVAFNFDGDALTSTGDYLAAGDTTPGRYYFDPNDPFTVVAWALPFNGVNAHDGPVLSALHVTSFGAPNAHDDGWRLNVTFPGRIPQFQRAANVQIAGSYDTAAGSALTTSSWSMLVGTYDGSDIRLYVNSVLAATTASAGAILGLPTNAQVGRGIHKLGDYGTWFYGGVGEGSIWSACFTQADIDALYAAATS